MKLTDLYCGCAKRLTVEGVTQSGGPGRYSVRATCKCGTTCEFNFVHLSKRDAKWLSEPHALFPAITATNRRKR